MEDQVPPPDVSTRDQLRVEDAVLLLDYALSRGEAVPKEMILTIRTAEVAVLGSDRKQPLGADEIAAVDIARRDLSRLLYPVTATSLRATAIRPDGKRSEAQRWSLVLWCWTAISVALVLISESVAILTGTFVPVDGKTDAEIFAKATSTGSAVAGLIPMLQPFLYGLFGACAYLLRRCHEVIHDRTFDRLRRSEYLNRMLLGFISGGAVGFFAVDLIDGEITESIGAATLAFLAGYSVDFVFTAIERLVAAVLPKVEPQEVPQAPAVQPKPVETQEL